MAARPRPNIGYHENGPLALTQIEVASAPAEPTTNPMSKQSDVARLTIVPSGMQFTLNGEVTNSIRVKVGQEVAFRNGEDVAHDLYSTSPLKAFDTGVLQNGDLQSVTFDRPGTLDIECTFHPDMRLTVNIHQ